MEDNRYISLPLENINSVRSSSYLLCAFPVLFRGFQNKHWCGIRYHEMKCGKIESNLRTNPMTSTLLSIDCFPSYRGRVGSHPSCVSCKQVTGRTGKEQDNIKEKKRCFIWHGLWKFIPVVHGRRRRGRRSATIWWIPIATGRYRYLKLFARGFTTFLIAHSESVFY